MPALKLRLGIVEIELTWPALLKKKDDILRFAWKVGRLGSEGIGGRQLTEGTLSLTSQQMRQGH
jgi:hypothetical protein